MPRQIAFACDHAAFHVKDTLIKMITSAGEDIEVNYLGPTTGDSVDYPDFAAAVCAKVASGEAEKGILVCGTGVGMSMAANKVNGIRAALCHDHVTTVLTRQHNNANVLCMGERVSGLEVIQDMIQTFLNTPFSDEARHIRRIEKVTALEKQE
ncbi:ribose 5-phosphate isomerase B [Angomonas deanei]|nr:ribose 5-phosphate isomerase B [Angomonas deanei]|eukprot:EPY15024.1 ribose 5-phosphate isomerase B [Angomonas deanei]